MKTRMIGSVAFVIFGVSMLVGARVEAQTTFFPMAPCRIVDTRDASIPNPNGGGLGAIAGSAVRNFQMRGFSRCGIPTTAKAVSLTVTVANPSTAGYVTLYPSNIAQPAISNINFSGGEAGVANGAVVMLSTLTNDLSCFMGTTTATHVVLDVAGYYQ